jgi:hypothetical protein
MFLSGIGICTDDIKNMTTDAIEALVAMVPDSTDAKALLNDALLDARNDEIDDADELAEYLGQGWADYEEAGIATVLAVVINACEGINMLATMSDGGYTFLIFQERAPWKYNQRERNLTETELTAIIGKYVRVLTSDDINVKFIEIEYD